jgi:hypothetical protein
MTEEETKLIAAMDELLSDKPATNTPQLTAYWAGSASQSVLDAYKEGRFVDIKI